MWIQENMLSLHRILIFDIVESDFKLVQKHIINIYPAYFITVLMLWIPFKLVQKHIINIKRGGYGAIELVVNTFQISTEAYHKHHSFKASDGKTVVNTFQISTEAYHKHHGLVSVEDEVSCEYLSN